MTRRHLTSATNGSLARRTFIAGPIPAHPRRREWGGEEVSDVKVKIDREGCISCGLCVSTCPEVFQIADDGRAEVVGEITADNAAAVQEAAENCPVNVIEIEE